MERCLCLCLCVKTFCHKVLCLFLGNYIRRQTERWAKQYEASKTHEIPTMDQLIAWLLDNVPENDTTTVVHGDFRLALKVNCIYCFCSVLILNGKKYLRLI